MSFYRGGPLRGVPKGESVASFDGDASDASLAFDCSSTVASTDDPLGTAPHPSADSETPPIAPYRQGSAGAGANVLGGLGGVEGEILPSTDPLARVIGRIVSESTFRSSGREQSVRSSSSGMGSSARSSGRSSSRLSGRGDSGDGSPSEVGLDPPDRGGGAPRRPPAVLGRSMSEAIDRRSYLRRSSSFDSTATGGSCRSLGLHVEGVGDVEAGGLMWEPRYDLDLSTREGLSALGVVGGTIQKTGDGKGWRRTSSSSWGHLVAGGRRGRGSQQHHSFHGLSGAGRGRGGITVRKYGGVDRPPPAAVKSCRSLGERERLAQSYEDNQSVRSAPPAGGWDRRPPPDPLTLPPRPHPSGRGVGALDRRSSRGPPGGGQFKKGESDRTASTLSLHNSDGKLSFHGSGDLGLHPDGIHKTGLGPLPEEGGGLDPLDPDDSVDLPSSSVRKVGDGVTHQGRDGNAWGQFCDTRLPWLNVNRRSMLWCAVLVMVAAGSVAVTIAVASAMRRSGGGDGGGGGGGAARAEGWGQGRHPPGDNVGGVGGGTTGTVGTEEDRAAPRGGDDRWEGERAGAATADADADADTVAKEGEDDAPDHPLRLYVSSLLLPLSPESADSLRFSNTPQARALEWLRSDGTGAAPSTDSEMLAARQRFALAALYFSLGGEDGVGRGMGGWLSAVEECRWDHVTCNYDDGGVVTGLDLAGAGISAGSELPLELGLLSDLESLILSTNEIGGTIPDVFDRIPRLRILHLDDCLFEGPIPESIGALTWLEELKLNLNFDIRGTIPDVFRGLKNLHTLDLQDNSLQGSMPRSFGSLKSLKNLLVGSNELTGGFEFGIENLVQLETLWAFRNFLSGSLPSGIGSLSKITDLSLDENQLSSSIPTEIGLLRNLVDFWVQKNNLGGGIPDTLGELSKLERFYADQNFLAGTIPNSIGGMTNCTHLYLNSNSLHGAIPDSISNMTSLEKLKLEGNDLTGTVPAELCILGLKIFSSDCAAPNPEVQCSCCTACW